ncbi:uncharacterized protein [Fopius arisanus]|uniref:Uncharacterized protein isoform X2 n=1 Tax=Fopius arisanus TaxID=64838 RepID=A0A9R1TFV5_9HYME|nr:PREDICTED: uncharacterized protein LOC105269672 isoform X2 [Fopius arisanus]
MDSIAFFSKIGETLVSELQNDEEKTIGKSWMEKIGEVEENEQRVRFMKMLIFCLQKNLLKTPLAQSVPEDRQRMTQTLENAMKFPESQKKDSRCSQGKLKEIYTATSGDLHEYFAVQEIDDEFMHGYYGISCDEPFFKNPWETSDVDAVLNEKFITSDIDDILVEEKSPEVDDKVKELCQCRNKAKPKVSIESRPTWGRYRYMERLIDQSPYTVGDLEVTEIDAMLHNFRDPRRKPRNH